MYESYSLTCCQGGAVTALADAGARRCLSGGCHSASLRTYQQCLCMSETLYTTYGGIARYVWMSETLCNIRDTRWTYKHESSARLMMDAYEQNIRWMMSAA